MIIFLPNLSAKIDNTTNPRILPMNSLDIIESLRYLF